MPNLNIILEGDNAWKDLKEKDAKGLVIHHTDAIGITALEGGMQSGRTSVMLRIDLPDGRTLLAETSLRLLILAARVFEQKYGSQE